MKFTLKVVSIKMFELVSKAHEIDLTNRIYCEDEISSPSTLTSLAIFLFLDVVDGHCKHSIGVLFGCNSSSRDCRTEMPMVPFGIL